MRKKNSEIMAILNGTKGAPTERFWRAEERIKKEAKILRDCLDGHTKSTMTLCLGMMIRYGLIKTSDLDQFSESLRKDMARLLGL